MAKTKRVHRQQSLSLLVTYGTLFLIGHPWSAPKVVVAGLPRKNPNSNDVPTNSLMSRATGSNSGISRNSQGRHGHGSQGQGGRGLSQSSSQRFSEGSTSSSRSLVALHDSFPCESDQTSPVSSSPNSLLEASSAPSPDSFNSSQDQNIHAKSSQIKISSTASLNTRGGAAADDDPSQLLNDDDLDKMVDDLIAGLEDNDDASVEAIIYNPKSSTSKAISIESPQIDSSVEEQHCVNRPLRPTSFAS